MVLVVYQFDRFKDVSNLKASPEGLTVSVILKVEKLIAPLGHDPYCIFHECADDEEASSCWYVSTASKSSSQQDFSSSTPGTCIVAICNPLLADIPPRLLTVLSGPRQYPTTPRSCLFAP